MRSELQAAFDTAQALSRRAADIAEATEDGYGVGPADTAADDAWDRFYELVDDSDLCPSCEAPTGLCDC